MTGNHRLRDIDQLRLGLACVLTQEIESFFLIDAVSLHQDALRPLGRAPPDRPIHFPVDQQLGERAALWVPSELADPFGHVPGMCEFRLFSDPSGISIIACTSTTGGSTLTPDAQLVQLVQMASRSPSGHNTQPWTIVRTGEQRLVLRSDSSRWLSMIDPTNRELLLSFGALIETIRQAAPAVGYRVDLQILADRAEASDIAQVDLAPTPAVSSTAPALIRSRATTRTPFLPVGLDPGDVDQILGADKTALSFVSRDGTQGRWLAEATAEAFAQQTWDDRKQGELAGWLRFSRRDIRTRGDGLTPEALGLSPLPRVVWYAALSRRQVLRPSFRRSSTKLTRKQLESCAGFLLVTSTDRSIGSLLEAGATYQRALLRATDLGVAHHTMSYALEEDQWRQEIDSALRSQQPIQFIVRVGRARHLAHPSIRRPPASLLENRM